MTPAPAPAPSPALAPALAPALNPAAGSIPGPSGRRTLATAVVLCELLAVTLPTTLGSLVQGWRYETPTSELVIVPPLAVALAVVGTRRHRYLARTPRGPVDGVVAVVLLGAAAALLWGAPRLGTGEFWAARLDVLAVPLVLAAGISGLLGVRALLVLRTAPLYAALAWPLPWAVLLELVADPVQAATGAALRAVVTATGWAAVVPGSGDLTLRVPASDDGFLVTVASACSGTSGLVGYLVVGLAGLALVGPRPGGPAQRGGAAGAGEAGAAGAGGAAGAWRRRLAWLVAGLPVVWLANLARLVLIAVVGGRFGEHAALDVLHPVAGVVVLDLAVVALAAALPLFGLRWDLGGRAAVDTPLLAAHPTGMPAPAGLAGVPASRTRSRLRIVVAAGLVGAAVLAGDLRVAALVRPAPNPVTVTIDTDAALAAHPLWQGSLVRTLPWSQAYFGAGATWGRYRLSGGVPGGVPGGGPGGVRGRRFTVWADVVSAPTLAGLLAHPVQDCYGLHGYPLDAVDGRRTVPLSEDVQAQALGYTRRDGERWQAVTWQWDDASTGRRRHERVTVLASFEDDDGFRPDAVRAALVASARALVDARQGRA